MTPEAQQYDHTPKGAGKWYVPPAQRGPHKTIFTAYSDLIDKQAKRSGTEADRG